MKKILISLSTIAAVAAIVVIGGTTAFFSDTETSTGNTFTAGELDLGIDNHSYYNGVLNDATTWRIDYDLSDNPPRQFFNFTDLKPGDWGEDTISLHVQNDAWLCADVTLTSNDDKGINEPEAEAGDVTDGVGAGELADNIIFYWWADDGDNVFEADETLLPAGSLGDVQIGQTKTVALADSLQNIWNPSQTPGPFPGDAVKFVAKAWCFGDATVTPYPQDGGNLGSGPDVRPLVCSGANETNITQTDGLTMDISFRAVQARNNPNFLCNNVPCPIVTENILIPGAGFEGEGAVVVAPQGWNIFPSVAGGWTVEWRDAGPTTFGSQTRPATAQLEFHNATLGAAYEGVQYVELDSDWGGPSDSGTGEPASVKIYQDIVTVPGQDYEIHYAFAPRSDALGADPNENNLEFRFGGEVVDVTGPTAGGGGGSLVWVPKVFTKTATTTLTRIEFTDLGTSEFSRNIP